VGLTGRDETEYRKIIRMHLAEADRVMDILAGCLPLSVSWKGLFRFLEKSGFS